MSFFLYFPPKKSQPTNQPTATFIDGIRNHRPKVAILVVSPQKKEGRHVTTRDDVTAFRKRVFHVFLGGGFNPHEKYWIVKLDHFFPENRGENKTCLSCHHPVLLYIRYTYGICSYPYREPTHIPPFKGSCVVRWFSFSISVGCYFTFLPSPKKPRSPQGKWWTFQQLAPGF